MTHWTDARIDHFRKGSGERRQKSDAEIATEVRMLLRSDLEHERVCVEARDRIAVLSREVHELREARTKVLELLPTGQIDGGHHKQWVLDQIARAILGNEYDAWVIAQKAGEDGPETYEYNEGIAP